MTPPGTVTRLYRFVAIYLCCSLLLPTILPALQRPTTALAAPAAPAVAAPVTAAQPTPPAEERGEATPNTAPWERPLSIARIQSHNATDDTLQVVFQVRNNLPPQRIPQITPGDTITDAIATAATVDYANDPNTIRNVLLVDVLSDTVSLLSSSRNADQQGQNFAWDLGDIPPQSRAALTLTLQLPAGSTPAHNIDDGARAWGTHQGRAVSAQALPLGLAPPDLSQWLISTPDANTSDPDMLAQLAAVGQDPAAIFAYVQGLGYEPYAGSLRGTRGTLWSAAGNSLDQASLLIAMLRASEVPARYRHGSLSTAQAQTLLNRMFPPPPGTVGYVPPDATLSDPLNDDSLLALTRDHWWVEAYLPGQGWTDLDPGFANASIGQSFANPATDGSDRIAEVPAELRHRVSLSLRVEIYSPFTAPSIGYPVSTVLSHTLNTVDIVGLPIALGHRVESDAPGGLVFATETTTYQPFLLVGDTFIEGTTYQDVLSNFGGGLGNQSHTAAWLGFEVHPPVGPGESYERTLVDRIGFAARQNGGNLNLNLSESGPLFDSFDIFTTLFLPGNVPQAAGDEATGQIIPAMERIESDLATLQTLAEKTSLSPAEETSLSEITYRIQQNIALYLQTLGITYAALADGAMQDVADDLLVRAYFAAPRIITIASQNENDEARFTIDLRQTSAKVIPYPGQLADMTYTFNLQKGLLESSFEGGILSAGTGQTAYTSAAVFAAAEEQGIDIVWLDQTTLDQLAGIPLSAEAQARITNAILDGKDVLVPQAMVQLGGREAIGWWELDPESGEMISVMEDGLHQATAYATFLKRISAPAIKGITYLQGFGTYGLLLLGQWWSRDFDKSQLGAAISAANSQAKQIEKAQNAICKAVKFGKCSKYSKGAAAMQSYLSDKLGNDPPLAEGLFLSSAVRPDLSEATRVLTPGASVASQALSGTLVSESSLIFAGSGNTSFYGPALTDLGLAGDALATSFANFGPTASLNQPPLQLMIGPASGTLTLGGNALAFPNGLALAGYDSALSITPQGPTLDAYALSGNADFFSLNLSPVSNSLAPGNSLSFQSELIGNLSSAYTLTVQAPDGWQVDLDAGGNVTAQVPLGTPPGDYALRLAAQSTAYPPLFVVAYHNVSVTTATGLDAALRVDPLTTIPWGTPVDASLATTNNGQVQIPNAAYRLSITNTGTSAHTFTVSVEELPSGWLQLSGSDSNTRSLRIDGGELGIVGLYISPTVTTLPAPGTSYPFRVDVQAGDVPTLSTTLNETFVMPAVPFAYVRAIPDQLISSPGLSTTLSLAVTNVGNAPGEFDLSLTRPISTWQATVDSPLNLAAGQGNTQSVILQTPSGNLGQTYYLAANVPSGNYIQSEVIAVLLDSPLVQCIAQARQAAEAIDAGRLNGALAALADEVRLLEDDLSNLSRRDAVIAAITQVALESDDYPPLPDDLNALAQTMRSHSSAGDIETDLESLCGLMNALSNRLSALAKYGLRAELVPAVQATLPGETVTLTLRLQHQGSDAATYRVSFGGFGLNDLPADFEVNLGPGDSDSQTISFTAPDTLRVYDLLATVQAIGSAPELQYVRTSAQSSLNVVASLVQVLAVTADPNFVESGVSATTIRADIANVAQVPQQVIAQTQIISRNRQVVASDSRPLDLSLNLSNQYILTTINTSNYDTGVYSVTLTLFDGLTPLTNGSGYTYFSVGEGLIFEQSIDPTLVTPGTARVTTRLSTTVRSSFETGLRPAESEAPPSGWTRQPLRPAAANKAGLTGTLVTVPSNLPSIDDTSIATDAITPPEPTPAPLNLDRATVAEEGIPVLPRDRNTRAGAEVERIESDDARLVYTGTWISVTSTPASNNQAHYSRTVSDTGTLSFTGTWVSLGFATNTRGGQAEVFLDGVSQDVIDTYSRNSGVASLTYSGLSSGTHSISVTVLGTANPLAIDTRVHLDYIDVWDGTPLPDGTFDYNDDRVFLSGGWFENASTGYIYTSGASNVWFHFEGDTLDLTTFAASNGDTVRLFVDDTYLGELDVYSTTFVTRTFSFDGLGSGLHTARVQPWHGRAHIKGFATPGSGPFYQPPVRSGIIRYEEDDPALRYNGLPQEVSSAGWVDATAGRASGGYSVYSRTPSDTVSLAFTGTWVALGYLSDDRNGQIEVFIDGESQGIVDTYSRDADVGEVIYSDLTPGTHVISATVLGSSNPLAGNIDFYFDYIDVWDGTTLPDEIVDDTDRSRRYSSNDWFTANSDLAIDGNYSRNGSNMWFPFTGDSVTLQSIATSNGGDLELFLNGQSQGYFSIYSRETTTRTFSFSGLGTGPHVLRVHTHHPQSSVDAFITPAISQTYEPYQQQGIIRIEEDDPAWRYNGQPFNQTANSWTPVNITAGSGGYVARSATLSDTASITFTGSWINLGFMTGNRNGQAEVFIDGLSRGIIDTYSRGTDTANTIYAGLGGGTHVLSITVLGTAHPLATDTRVDLDYIDVWNGTDLPNGSFEEADERIRRSSNWSNINNNSASNGSYDSGGSNMWFPFTGDSLSFQTIASINGGIVELLLDGQLVTQLDLYHPSLITRTFSLTGLGAGPHIFQVNAYRGQARVDQFRTPGNALFFAAPELAFTRYEEDAAALRYNGEPFPQRPATWDDQIFDAASGGYIARSDTVSDTVSLVFTGTWLSLGLQRGTNHGQVEVFIDGLSQGIIDNYAAQNGLAEVVYPNLLTGTHVLSIQVLASRNISATDTAFSLDYIDVWDSNTPPPATLSETDARLYRSRDWRPGTSLNASDSTFLEQGSTGWFHFVGDSVTVIALTDPDQAIADVWVDGVSRGPVEAVYPFSPSSVALALDGFGPGPHVLRLDNQGDFAIDGFKTDDSPFLGVPMVEWYDDNLGGRDEGALTTASAGDINNDGLVELLVTSYGNSTGTLTLYRGDGADAGDGTPVLWRAPVGLGDTPAFADFDGDGLAEIVVGSNQGVYAFDHDGTPLWFTDEIKPHAVKYRVGVNIVPWGGAAIGNVNADPAPEIVAVGHLEQWPTPGVQQQRLLVFDTEGQVLARYDMPVRGEANTATPPLLSDLTGDGQLDILVGQRDQLVLLTYGLTTTEVVWQRGITLTYPDGTIWAEGTWGAPAVADVDGKLPGGDAGPEIAMAWDGLIELIDADGSLIWSYPLTGSVNPGSVSIADTDGDNEVEIITVQKRAWPASEQDIIVLNADGSLLWTAEVIDRTTSSSGVSVIDFDGDGLWEVIWNGDGSGLSIFDGRDGTLLFNEPIINSGTVMDYPIIVDTDQDGRAELVANDGDGIYIVGHDAVWGTARPLWNQNNYHLSNINDDLSVPVIEPDSWRVHNTYRTQTPVINPAPVYPINLTHTLAVSGVIVVPDSLSAPATVTGRDYQWNYRQYWYDTPIVTQFEVELDNVRPGEVRRISEGSEVVYQLQSGVNRLTLPPLTVIASPQASLRIEPEWQSVPFGQPVTYTLILSDPARLSEQYNLSIDGLGLGGNGTLGTLGTLNLGQQLTLSPSGLATLSLVVAAQPQSGFYPFTATATPVSANRAAASTAGAVQAEAALSVERGPQVEATLNPDPQIGSAGSTAVLTLTVSNLGIITDTYALDVTLPDGWTYDLLAKGQSLTKLSLSPSVFNEANLRLEVNIPAATASSNYPLTATVTSVQYPQVSATAAAMLQVSPYAVAVSIDPATQGVQPSEASDWQVTITNTGTLSDTYNLSVTGLVANAARFTPTQVSLAAGAAATVNLTVGALPFALPGNYDVNVIAASQNAPGVRGQDAATLQLAAALNVDVALAPALASSTSVLTAEYLVLITNTGNIAGFFTLEAQGPGDVQLGANLADSEIYLPPGMGSRILLTVEICEAGAFAFNIQANAATQASDSEAGLFQVGLFNRLYLPLILGDDQMAGRAALTAEMVPLPQSIVCIVYDRGTYLPLILR